MEGHAGLVATTFRVGVCMEIAEPFKHLFRASIHHQFLFEHLWMLAWGNTAIADEAEVFGSTAPTVQVTLYCTG